jgi:hypothetical protein
VRTAGLRWESRKGFKDRCDILSLLRLETLDVKFLRELLHRNMDTDASGDGQEIG